jgi:hypothetical protein
MCPLMSLGWVNLVPVDLASLSGSVIAWTTPNVGALSNYKGATFTENPGLLCLIAHVDPQVTDADR